GQYLCHQGGRPMFELRPDFVIEGVAGKLVVDAKWKLLDELNVADHYDLREGDIYQLFAYGQRYLNGSGRLILIFPATDTFLTPLEPFDLQGGLSLEVVPLDLERGSLKFAHSLRLDEVFFPSGAATPASQ